MIQVFTIFLRLGLTSFGGPVAHIAYFRTEFVTRRRWLDEHAYAAIVGFCQFLPGPASSQVAMALGQMRAGMPGLLAAWIGFALPSGLAMVLFAFFLASGQTIANAPWIHGLKLAAVALVAQALLGMARTLTPDFPRLSIAALCATIALFLPNALGQVGALLLAALLGFAMLKPDEAAADALPSVPGRAWLPLLLFAALLIVLPVLAAFDPSLARFDAFYRAGSLVFGGGHVVLPLLQGAVVTPGWIGNDTFMAGYGAAQAMPGPLFSFAAFLGAVLSGWGGALLCLFAIYLPSLLLVSGGWPLWRMALARPGLRAAFLGTNAGVTGLLAAALYSPVLTSAVFSPVDAGIALAALGLLLWSRAPAWAVVVLCAGWTSAAAFVLGV
ncbi:MAG TPA: chromate efflux transporter [Rhizomicrobium sp.]|nr:chromate efflux transporter [Rhizomicrobium sp.]